MAVQHRRTKVPALQFHIINQQANPHPPVSRFKQLIGKQPADEIVLIYKILNIDASFRTVRQQGPRNKSIQTVPQ